MRRTLFILCVFLGLTGSLILSFFREADGLRLDVLNVGQGDAILLSLNGQRILIDGGPDATVLEELGEVLPFWEHELDLVVLTHPHEDHVAGLVPVLQRFQVDAVLLSAPEYPNEAYSAFLAEVQQQSIFIHSADSSEDFTFDGLELDVLYPFESVAGAVFENVNNASVVIRAVYGEHEILLMGDAEQEVEAELLAAGVNLNADLLKGGHHGSRTSSTWEFLQAVGAEVMIISSGTGNDYGHPHEETLEKAEDLGIQVRRTDVEGRITLLFE